MLILLPVVDCPLLRQHLPCRPTVKIAHDYDKLARHCSDMARALEKKIDSQFLAESNIQLIGALILESALSFYGLSQQGYMSFLSPLGETHEVPSFRLDLTKFLKLLKLVVRVRLHLENMSRNFYHFEEAQMDESTVIPNLPNPKKSKSTRPRQEKKRKDS